MKFISWNTPVVLIFWLLLQPVAMCVCVSFSEWFAAALFPDFLHLYGFPSGLKVGFARLECAFCDMIGVTIVGAVIIFRHQYGSRKFWRHCGIWYAVYLLLTMSVIVLMATDWGQMWGHSFVMILTMNCLYPPLVLLGLMSAVLLRRLLIKGVLKNNNGDNELSLT